MTESIESLLASAAEAYLAHDRAEAAKRAVVLQEVQGIVSEAVYADILAGLEECLHTYDFMIAVAPLGEEQDQGAAWGKTYVNQTTNGGWSGDDYAGTMSIPLGDGRYLQFAYAM